MKLFLILPVLLGVAILAWFLRIRRRHRMSAAVILNELHPNETALLETFILRDDFLADDRAFWKASNGWRGLCRKRHNAICLVQFCQNLVPGVTLERLEIRWMTTRATLICFYTGCSVVEAVLRWFVKDFPHACARNATNLYWEMEGRATTLCSIYRPDLLDQIHQIL
jgi:hypothetical protein